MQPLHSSVVFLLLLIGLVTFGVVLIVIFDQPGFIKTTLISENILLEEGVCALPLEETDGSEESQAFLETGVVLPDGEGEGEELAQQQQRQPQLPTPLPYVGDCYCSCHAARDNYICDALGRPVVHVPAGALLCRNQETIQATQPPRYWSCFNNGFYTYTHIQSEEQCTALNDTGCLGHYLYGPASEDGTSYAYCTATRPPGFGGGLRGKLANCQWASRGTPTPQQQR